jgi:hypothetical protein
MIAGTSLCIIIYYNMILTIVDWSFAQIVADDEPKTRRIITSSQSKYHHFLASMMMIGFFVVGTVKIQKTRERGCLLLLEGDVTTTCLLSGGLDPILPGFSILGYDRRLFEEQSEGPLSFMQHN